MGAVAYRAAAELRRALRSAVGITLLIAVLGGLVLAAVAGARRTASAYPRMLEVTAAPDILVSPPGAPGADPRPFYDAVRQLDGVEHVAVISGMGALPLAGSATAERIADAVGVGAYGIMFGPTDGGAGYELRKPLVTEGRMPDPDALDEVFVSRNVARRRGLQLGDVLELVLLSGERIASASDPFDEASGLASAEHGRVLELTVVGTGPLHNEVIAYSDLDDAGALLVSPAVAALQGTEDQFFGGAVVGLAPGADRARTIEAIRALGDDPAMGTGGPVFVSDERAQAATVQDGLRPIAVALAAFALAVAFVALVVVGQALARHTRPAAGDQLALRAMGVQTSQRALVPLARALAIAVAGALGAVVVAVALSPRFPIGPARIAEPTPGVHVDGAVLGLGAVAVVVLVLASLAPTAVLRARRERHRRIALAPAATATAGALRLPPPVVQGVRFTFGAGSDGSAPARSTLVVSMLAVVAVLGTAAFARGLTDLVDDPLRYGQRWDGMLDASFAPAPVPLLLEQLHAEPSVRGVAAGNYGELVIGGLAVPAIELTSLSGDVGLTVVEGRQAEAPQEIVLGGEVLDRLGLEVGEAVGVDAGDGEARYEVVGRAVFPRLGRGSFDGTGLGIGAQVAPGPLALFDAEAILEEEDLDPADFAVDGRYYAFLAVDLAGRPEAAEDLLHRTAVAAGVHYLEVRGELPPTTIRDLDRVRAVPAALAAVLALVAIAALAHHLGATVRERRRELSLLRTLGFSGWQIRATVLSASLLLAFVAVGIGVPLGVAAGRSSWQAFAESLYVDGATATPWAWIAGSLPVALGLAGAMALLPARRAARLRPALGLRDEVAR